MTTTHILLGLLILAFIAGAGILHLYKTKLIQDLTAFLEAHHVKNAAGDATTILTTLSMIADIAVRAATAMGLNGAELLAQAEADAAQLAGEFGITFTPAQVAKSVQAAAQKIGGVPVNHGTNDPTGTPST